MALSEGELAENREWLAKTEAKLNEVIDCYFADVTRLVFTGKTTNKTDEMLVMACMGKVAAEYLINLAGRGMPTENKQYTADELMSQLFNRNTKIGD